MSVRGMDYGLICYRGHRTYRRVFGGVDVGRVLCCEKREGSSPGKPCGAAYKVVQRLEDPR